ncbi:hypothetical protein A3E39_00105 [Candidatus Uhrbacteria bacterium RIFCSPHIGHO2_12_FULL_60_25]|uniref:Carboxypeptidase regulatory-like domain-containing protein n=1 Tax=Candidatus Uhrbacteria bacterium RIFCSPHIGHO2_12_FULL_60_25 TaxID=1802399 RepID=A0A1F7UMM6_9BACT|nr:MAG: hypothetical protein A3E39_00105 [Candidatus Uhrbacteria bacterium RIFCSPHIGHO2_12_FULL_60_25]
MVIGLWYLVHIIFGLVLLGLLHLTRPAYLAFTRGRKGYGVVFNSVTGIPESLVSIRLVLPGQFGTPVSTAVSDKHGRYRLTAKPGEYIVQVVKTGFAFPSEYLKTHSSVYDNILPVSRIIVKDHGIITKNIPVDPVGGGRAKLFSWRLHLNKNVQAGLGAVGPITLWVYPYLSKSVIAWVLYLLYVSAIGYRLFTFKPGQPAFGTIRDAETGELARNAVVRIFNAKANKLLETQITSERGRFAFVVHPGAYYVTIQKPGYKTTRINFPKIAQDAMSLVKDVRLKYAKEKPGEGPVGQTTEAPTEGMYQGF